MKANELMIGDWFRYSYTIDGREKVKTFRIGRIENELGKYYVWGNGFGRMCYPDRLEPIPITPEILEKNGFKARGYEELVLETDEYCFALQKGVDGRNAWWWEMFSSPIIPINYVHELQHALRLCGIKKEIVL